MHAVLFDLDGTLNDRVSGLVAFARDQFTRFGIDARQLTEIASRFVALDANGKVWKTEVYSQIIKEFALKGNPAVETLVHEYIRLYPNFAVAMADAKNVLEALKARQIAVAIVTNGRSDVQRSVITALGFDALVSAIVISEEVAVRKPQRQIFEIALRQLGVKASEAIFVGDDPIADIEGALNAGLYPIAFNCATSDGMTTVTALKDVLQLIDQVLR